MSCFTGRARGDTERSTPLFVGMLATDTATKTILKYSRYMQKAGKLRSDSAPGASGSLVKRRIWRAAITLLPTHQVDGKANKEWKNEPPGSKENDIFYVRTT